MTFFEFETVSPRHMEAQRRGQESVPILLIMAYRPNHDSPAHVMAQLLWVGELLPHTKSPWPALGAAGSRGLMFPNSSIRSRLKTMLFFGLATQIG